MGRRVYEFLQCVGEAVIDKGLRGLLREIPFAEGLYDIAANALQRYRQHRQAAAQLQAIRQEFEQAAQAKLDDFERDMRQVVAEVAADQPPPVQEALTQYLTLIPARIRQTFARPEDPTGTTVPATWLPQRPEDLLPLLPPRPPRFKAGDSPPNNPKWVLVERLGLGDLLRCAWPSDPARRVQLATDMVRSLARTVGYCHRLNPPVVHRDLKPGNVLIAPGTDGSSRLKITDFGIGDLVARQALDEPRQIQAVASLSTPTMIRAAHTPLYASPQQKAGLPPDPRDDVHALGVIWYQFLLANFNQGPGTDFRDELADLGVDEDRIALLGRCVSARPERRPLDAQTLADELGRLTPHPVPSEMRRGSTSESLDAQLATLIREAEAKNTEARTHFDRHDYAAAVTLLEAIPLSRLRDTDLYSRAMQHRDRVAHLEATIRPRVLAGPHDGLLELVEEYLRLLPGHVEMTRVSEHLRKLHERERLQAGQPFTNSLGMKLAFVPRGTFWMGGEGGQPGSQQFKIPYDFYLGIYLVTQEQWQAVMGNNPSYFAQSGGGKDKVRKISDEDLKHFPVECVSWEDAQQFIEKLNALDKATNGWGYRLPTEAEWEYSCRGGATSQNECAFDFYFDQPTNDLSSSLANSNGNRPAGKVPKGRYLERTSKVGSYQPNRLGKYDMHGNVWEWCEGSNDEGSGRVIRGGSWCNEARLCRAANRVRTAPTARINNLGFRLARVPSGQ